MYDGKERFDPIIYDNGLHFTHSMMCNAGGSFWEMHTNQSKITLFLYKNGFCLWRKSHLWVDVTSSLRPFHALRQPVQVTGCRGASFCLWKGVNEYEPEIRLPRLWDLFGL